MEKKVHGKVVAEKADLETGIIKVNLKEEVQKPPDKRNSGGRKACSGQHTKRPGWSRRRGGTCLGKPTKEA